MKKTANATRRRGKPAEMRREYRFNYGKARPNRFAGRAGDNRMVVVLDPDVAQVFATPDAANNALRALIAAFKTTSQPRLRRASRRSAGS